MLLLVGMNHRSAPLDLRERLAIPEDDATGVLDRLVGLAPVEEAMVLSTCNRVEVLARATDVPHAEREVRAFLAASAGLEAAAIDRHVYAFHGEAAVRHLFGVAAGLDSVVLGEPQILGQVKRAYEAARLHGATGPILDRLVQHALSAAKRVRRETGIARHAVSVASSAVRLARGIFDDLEGRRALVLGAGKMTELAARHLQAQGIAELTIANRTFARAAEVAGRLAATAVAWEDGLRALSRADVVLTGTAAAHPILTRAAVREAIKARPGRPLLILDIAVPRDVAADVNTLDGVYVYDVDDLQGLADEGLVERRRAAEQARALLASEGAAFERWRQSKELGPTIAALSDRWHDIARAEIARHAGRLGALTPEQQAAVEELLRATVQKALHTPIVALKSAADRGEAAARARLYREIFGLDEQTPVGPRRLIRGGKDD